MVCKVCVRARTTAATASDIASGERELHPLLDGMILAAERGDGDERPVSRRRGPAGLVGKGLVTREKPVLQGLREDAPFAPTPDHVPRLVDHDEVVRLAAGEGELEALVGVVRHPEREANALLDVDVERGVDGWGVGGVLSDRRQLRGMRVAGRRRRRLRRRGGGAERGAWSWTGYRDRVVQPEGCPGWWLAKLIKPMTIRQGERNS